MPPEHKFWAVISAIADASDIAPTGNTLRIPFKDLEEYVTSDEAVNICQMLADGEMKCIQIISPPTVENGMSLEVAVIDEEAFKRAFDAAHYSFFGTVEKLTGDHLFAVMEAAQNIHEQLEMTRSNEIVIPAMPLVISHRSLMPFNQSNYHDRYIRLRGQALRYMVENGYLKSAEINRAMFAWEASFSIEVDRREFTKFFKRLLEIYHLRVKNGDSDGESSDDTAGKGEPEFHFDQGVLHRDGSNGVEIFPEKTLEHTVMIAAFQTKFGERIDNATHPIECGWDKLYDAARRINTKISQRFGVKDFFKIDHKNKFIQRNVK